MNVVGVLACIFATAAILAALAVMTGLVIGTLLDTALSRLASLVDRRRKDTP